MQNFSEFPLHNVLQSNLTRHGFVQPTPVQTQAIQPQLDGRDLLITAQTGTGKTLAFLLPLLDRLLREGASAGVNALVLSPTRELAIQIGESFKILAAGTGLNAAIIVGGMGEQNQLKSVRNGAKVVIATPGRLQDFLGRGLIKLNTAKAVILDEADRMLDMGFLPTIKKILASLPAGRQTVFCSATIENSVAHLVNAHLKNPVRIAVGSTTKPVEHIDLHVYEVEEDRKLGLLEKMLQDEHGSFLVFARTKHGADRLAKKLVRSGSKATAIHGNRSQSQRNLALRGFQEGSYRILVATDVAARGVHVEGIAHVVNYDLPQLPEDFVHRVGRTGRAGARGTASTFSTRSQRAEIRKIERTLDVRLQPREVPAELRKEVTDFKDTAAGSEAGNEARSEKGQQRGPNGRTDGRPSANGHRKPKGHPGPGKKRAGSGRPSAPWGSSAGPKKRSFSKRKKR
ncbi:MAG: DEAD/DEAH box helicase [Bryobacteraceae bacterium]